MNRPLNSLEPLIVSSDGRRLTTASGAPFFYLADTAWTLPQRLKWDDALHYMNRRRMQGFTALQIVALDPERDLDMRDPAGNPALHDGDLSRPNVKYFEYLDRVLDMAERMGFYVLLLPVWGQLVVGESWGGQTYPRTVTEDNAFEFGRWIGDRYRHRTNIIWCLGGDRQPIHKGVDYRDVWRRMAEGLAFGVTGIRCRWNRPDPAWDSLLITYHTCFEMETGEYSTMSYWTDEEAWLDLILLQSGHGLRTANFTAVQHEYGRSRAMPVIDAEPAYERMPMNWPQIYPLHGDAIVRRRAYWALLGGAAGHTYGHASVWCMISEKERNEVLDASWFEALSAPGAQQMSVLRNLVETLSFDRWVPDQRILAHADLCHEGCLDTHRQAARDRDGAFIIVYLTGGGTEDVDLSGLRAGEALAAWVDPRTGGVHDVGEVSRGARFTRFAAPSSGAEEDWLLVVSVGGQYVDELNTTREWASPIPLETMSMIWAE